MFGWYVVWCRIAFDYDSFQRLTRK